MNEQNSKLAEYEKHHHKIYTHLGGITADGIEFVGVNVTGEIAGKMSQTGALLLWLLGRRPLPLETRLLDTLIGLNIYPDMRIWCMRTGAYAAASGAPLSACYAASHASLDAEIFGVRASIKFGEFFNELEKQTAHRPLEDLIEERLKRKDFFPGFGRPLIQGPDERCIRLSSLLKEWDYPLGKYFRLLEKLKEILTRRKNLYPNYAAYFVALLLDPPFELDMVKIAAVAHSMVNIPALVTVSEIKARPLGTPLLPLKVSDIVYTGREKRSLKG